LVDGFLFDAGGVLVLPDPTVIGPLLELYGAPSGIDPYVRAHYAGMAAKSEQGADEHDWHAYDVAYVQALAVAAADAEEAATVLGRTRTEWLWRYPVDGAREALRALGERGVPIGVVSNANGQIERVLRRVGVVQVGEGRGAPVRCVVDSHVVGVAKPDPRVFDAGLAALGLPADRVGYVGDSVTMDIGGARAAGLVPILVDPFGDHPEADFLTVRTLDELVAWI
jgi:putative hydrolase of the HAD superfamily